LIDVPPDLIGALPSGHERSIVATYRHSLLKLSDPGRDYLRLASHLSPAGISNALAQQVFQLTDELEETRAKKIRRQAVAACTQLSLAKKVGNAHQVHALTCAVVQHLGWSADQRGILLRNSAIDALATIIDPEMTYDQSVKITAELEHARHLTSASIGETELRLLIQLAGFDYRRGIYSLALESYQRILALEQANKGPEHPHTLTSMNNLASTLSAMGDHQGAKKLHEQVLELRKKILSPEHPNTTLSAWNLYITLNEIGENIAAQQIMSKNLLWLIGDEVILYDGYQIQIREMLKQELAEMNRSTNGKV
jgi:tetratricopeptide (TPR) repeat protein